MPPVSEAQRRAMFAAKAGKSNLGIPQKVGAEFVKADPGGKLPKVAKGYQEGGAVGAGGREVNYSLPWTANDPSRTYSNPNFRVPYNRYTGDIAGFQAGGAVKPNPASHRNYAKGGKVK